MKHLGDITKLKGDKVPIVDIVCGGSPCQDLSVAGKRAGMKHSDKGDDETTRSGLFMEQIRIIKEMRDADRQRTGKSDEFLRPRFMVFENVEGLFSSNDGEDFRIVLEETARIADSSATIPRLADGQSWSHSGCILGDKWSIAWRLHDAQFWGVPQRRKRVSLVADFGSQSAPEILFERESVSGNIESSGAERERPSADLERSIGESGSFTLKVRGGNEYDSNGRKAGKGALIQEELSGTIGVSQDQTLITLEGNGARESHNGNGYAESETMFTLNATEQHGVAYGLDRASFNQGQNAKYDFSVEQEIAQPIVARGAGGG